MTSYDDLLERRPNRDFGTAEAFLIMVQNIERLVLHSRYCDEPEQQRRAETAVYGNIYDSFIKCRNPGFRSQIGFAD